MRGNKLVFTQDGCEVVMFWWCDCHDGTTPQSLPEVKSMSTISSFQDVQMIMYISDQGTLQSQFPPTGLLRKVLRIPSWRLLCLLCLLCRCLHRAMHHQHVPGEVFVYLRFCANLLPIPSYSGRMQRFPPLLKPTKEAKGCQQL